MMNGKIYSNAPIQEAVIDFRIEHRQDFDISELDNFHDKIKSQLSEKAVQNSQSFTFDIVNGASGKLEIDGFSFHNTDRTKILQLTKTGFTFSYLNKYTQWDLFHQEMLSFYKLFIDELKPTRIVRTALRYINRIEIPTKNFKVSDYFETRIKFKDEKLEPQEWLLKAQTNHGENKCIITEALDTITRKPDTVAVILDIDVFQEKIIDPSNLDIIKAIINDMRTIKNNKFEDSLTEKAKKGFE